MRPVALFSLPAAVVLAAAWSSDSPPPAPPSVFEMDGARAHEFVRRGPEQAREALLEITRRARGLEGVERAELVEAGAALYEACPYSRATYEVVRTLHHGLDHARTAASRLECGEGAVRPLRESVLDQETELDTLANLLDVHEATLGALGFGPRSPESTRPVLSTLDALAMLHTIRGEVDALDSETRETIADTNRVLARHSAQLWDFKTLLIEYRSDLHQLAAICDASLSLCEEETDFTSRLVPETRTRSASLRDEVQQMIALLDAHISLYC